MDKNDEKIRIINDILNYVLNENYDIDTLSTFILVKSLDEKTHRYGDEYLNNLLGILRGMSAGEEFHYSKEEVIEMLRSYKNGLNMK